MCIVIIRKVTNNKIVIAYCLSFIDFIEPIRQQLFPIRLFEIQIHLLNCKAMFANIIQLIHSFEVNIRICQPKISDVHQEIEVNITFEG